MGRKGGLVASIFSTSRPRHSKPGAAASAPPSSPPWPWPPCATKPQTASFRGQSLQGGDGDRPCTTTTAAAAGRLRFDEAAVASAAGGRLRPTRGTAVPGGDEMYKTVNSVYFDAAADDSCRSFFFDDDDGGCGGDAADDVLDDGSLSFSTTTASEEWSEAVIRSLGRTSTDRFFFDAGPTAHSAAAASNSILAGASPLSASPSPGRTLAPSPPVEEAPRLLQAAVASSPAAGAAVLSDDLGSDDGASEAETELELLPPPPTSSSLVEDSVAVALDSEDPFRDFRASMHEMVAAHGLRDWPALQDMLLWYLRINGKHNHALIVGAFVDLLVSLATTTATSSSASPSAATTALTTTTSTTACCCSCSCSTSTSSGTSSGGGGTSTAITGAAAATMMTMGEQCGITSAGASCSSASSDLEEEAAAGERSRNGHSTSSEALDSS